ncbi:MAG: 4Fe-4S binding protein [Peptococcaceae bacterium]|nr:4Fe-4S binding protein [Peptococcaceae bacterium]
MKHPGAETEINEQVTWREITVAGRITGGGTSKLFETGDWRTERPVLDWEKCRQCLLCAPVCPDSSIPVAAGKRLDFDYSHCKGCGVCRQVCPFAAITMVKEQK